MKILVTGVHGQLGHDVMNELALRGYEGLGTDIFPLDEKDGGMLNGHPYAQLDITDREAVHSLIREYCPDAVVHCAAWTAVDAAEDEENRAKVDSINHLGTLYIAEAAKAADAKMVYLSTDYVFDGQHTIAARVERNGGIPLPILCKVYLGLSEQDEASLFAKQTGVSAPVAPGQRVRAEVFSGDPLYCNFLFATEAAGAKIDYDQRHGKNRIACISTAFEEYQKIGDDKYREAIRLLIDGWDGDPDSLRAETVKALCRFVDLYEGEYDRKRLVRQFRKVDPLFIVRNGRALSNTLPGYKKYLYQVIMLYNGRSTQYVLPIKF